MGNTELLCMQCRGIGPHLAVNGKYGFSRVLAGTLIIFSSYDGDGPFKTHVSSATSGFLYHCEGHFTFLLELWHGYKDASQGEAGDPGSLSSCHRDIGIPINFQDESDIVSF